MMLCINSKDERMGEMCKERDSRSHPYKLKNPRLVAFSSTRSKHLRDSFFKRVQSKLPFENDIHAERDWEMVGRMEDLRQSMWVEWNDRHSSPSNVTLSILKSLGPNSLRVFYFTISEKLSWTKKLSLWYGKMYHYPFLDISICKRDTSSTCLFEF